ncbi:permease-like cell division protein FtsX [Nonomuraea fuscirosea]|uniref:permease-like cell division protein FtsX n=1 Tax=Nonomuraea fuscirosea TaxID=1291556 RepID=UPI002DDAC1CB|nr:permease-like cell division protein FtsX [Nonomuraea fuscirosea]WSA51401.1 permease-like cell division protein FtsX [Nonomuraea fuscirosea]
MNSPVEDRLREALTDAGATIDTSTLRPLRSPERRRFRMDLRMVSVATAVVLAGTAAFAAFGPGGGDQDSAVTMNPPAAQSKQPELVAFLCTASSKQERCGVGDVPADRIQQIETTLKELPQVESVRYTSRASAYESLSRDFAQNQALLKAVKITDVPASFTMTLSQGADVSETLGRLKSVTDIDQVVNPTDVPPWEQTAEQREWPLKVFLCKKDTMMPACGAKRSKNQVVKEGKGATPAEKKALEELMGKMPEVTEFEYIDQQAEYEDFRKAFETNQALLDATRPEDLPASFRLKLKPGFSAQSVFFKLRGQPGVAQISDRRCLTDSAALSFTYGIELPESEVCLANG